MQCSNCHLVIIRTAVVSLVILDPLYLQLDAVDDLT